MIEATFRSARELIQEIWCVEQDVETPEIARVTGRVAERLTNLGTVLVYAVLVSYAAVAFYHLVPGYWAVSYESVKNTWWFWVGIVLLIVTALRFGLEITKLLKRWNVASLLGSLLVFDLLLKGAPPLFGVTGFSPVDFFCGTVGNGNLAEVMRKALGL